MSDMPKVVWTVLLLLGTAALIPVACIAKSRATRSPDSRLHLWYDMDNQGRFKSQQRNPMFADSRAMRRPVIGTVARGELFEDDALHRGTSGEGYVDRFPFELTMQTLERGRERYDIFCAPCHGLSGYGDGIVSKRAEALQQGTWVPPASLHTEPATSREVGHLFNTITNGIRTMPAYRASIPVDDRWAIVGYIRALQRSQASGVDDVPSELRSSLR